MTNVVTGSLRTVRLSSRATHVASKIETNPKALNEALLGADLRVTSPRPTSGQLFALHRVPK